MANKAEAGSGGGGDASKYSTAQMNVAKTISNVATAEGMDELALEIALITAIQESTLRNLDYGPDDSVGVFQQRLQYWGQGARATASAAKLFFRGRTGYTAGLDSYNYHEMTPGEAAQAVQGSAYPDKYDQWLPDAKAIIMKLGVDASKGVVGASGDPGPGGVSHSGVLGEASSPYVNTVGTTVQPVTVVDVSSVPYQFNPLLHPTLLPRRVDYSVADSTSLKASIKDWNREIYQPKKLDFKTADAFEGLRQGRITMSNEALSFTGTPTKRWGFRFLYNPSSISGSQQVRNDVIIDPQDKSSYFLQQGLESISLTLFLNRVPDVIGKAPKGQYNPVLSEEDYQGIQRRGTNWDLEYLYRCANGQVDTATRKGTGDIGILLPNPCELVIGPGLRYYGALASIQVSDIMFSMQMVPVLTQVTVLFSCFVNLTKKDTIALQKQANLVDPAEFEDETTGGDDALDTSTEEPEEITPTEDWGIAGASWQGRSLLTTYVSADADQIVAMNGVKNAMTYNSASASSDHPSHAVDFMIPGDADDKTHIAQGNKVASYALENRKAFHLKYIIWNRRIISNRNKWSAWRPYDGSDNPHTDHVHVSWSNR